MSRSRVGNQGSPTTPPFNGDLSPSGARGLRPPTIWRKSGSRIAYGEPGTHQNKRGGHPYFSSAAAQFWNSLPWPYNYPLHQYGLRRHFAPRARSCLQVVGQLLGYGLVVFLLLAFFWLGWFYSLLREKKTTIVYVVCCMPNISEKSLGTWRLIIVWFLEELFPTLNHCHF